MIAIMVAMMLLVLAILTTTLFLNGSRNYWVLVKGFYLSYHNGDL